MHGRFGKPIITTSLENGLQKGMIYDESETLHARRPAAEGAAGPTYAGAHSPARSDDRALPGRAQEAAPEATRPTAPSSASSERAALRIVNPGDGAGIEPRDWRRTFDQWRPTLRAVTDAVALTLFVLIFMFILTVYSADGCS